MELLEPVVADLHRVQPLFVVLDGVPLLAGVAEDLLQVVGVERVQDVEEIVTSRAFIFRENIGEILRELLVLLELRPELRHRELVVLRDLDLLHVLLLEQLLLIREDLLEEVFIHLALGRQVVLD